MLSLTTIDHPDGFESFCGSLCSHLELGAPVHLAPGPDRGKDLLTRTPLRTGGERTFSIHIECKFSTSGRPIGVRDLVTHCAWAEARQVDVLLLMTNSRLTASAVDWIEEMSVKRSYPVVVWDGEFLENLTRRLHKDSKPGGSPVDSVHRLLVERWREHRTRGTLATFDPLLEEQFEAPRIAARFDFVNREKELQELVDFSRYRLAAITGPAGIGKTSLAHRVIEDSDKAGYRTVVTRLDDRGSNLQRFSVTLARTLEVLFDDTSLTSSLRVHLWEDVSDLLSRIVSKLSEYPLYVLLENVHVLTPGSEVVRLLELIQASVGRSRFLLTSRLEPLWGGCLITPDRLVRLSGFAAVDIREYLTRKSIDCPESVVSTLATEYRGWPILVSLSCDQLGAPEDSAALATSLTRGSLQSARTLAQGLLASLSKPARSLFALLSCLRAELSPDEVRVVSNLPDSGYEGALLELSQKGLINPAASPLDSTHDLLRQILRPVLADAGKANRCLARYLLTFDRDADRVLAAAEHYLAASDPRRAVQAIVSHQDAILRAGRVEALLQAIAFLGPEKVPEIVFAELAIVRARCLELQGFYHECIDTLRTFIHADSEAHLAPSVLAQSRYWEARSLYFLARYEEANRCLAQARKALESISCDTVDPSSRCLEGYILLQMARLEYIARDLNEATSLCFKAQTIFEKEEDPIGANTVLHRLAMIAILEGRLNEGLESFKRVRVQARRHRDAKRESYALHRIGIIKRMQEDWQEAGRFFYESLRIKTRIGHRRGFVYSHIELAYLSLATGDLSDAEQHIRKAESYADSLEMPKEQARILVAWATLAKSQGDLAGAVSFGEKAALRFENIGLEKRAATIRRGFRVSSDGRP